MNFIIILEIGYKNIPASDLNMIGTIASKFIVFFTFLNFVIRYSANFLFANFCLLKASMNFMTPDRKNWKMNWKQCKFLTTILFFHLLSVIFLVLIWTQYTLCQCPIPSPDPQTIRSVQFSLFSSLNVSFYSIYILFVLFLSVLRHTPSICMIIFHI